MVRAGEGDEPRFFLYETAEGAFDVAVELPGAYTDAWRVETIDELIDSIEAFDPSRHLGFDWASAVETGRDEDTIAQDLLDQVSSVAPAFQRMVGALLRTSPAAPV